MEKEYYLEKIKNLFNSYNYSGEFLSQNILLEKNKFNLKDYNKVCSDLIKIFHEDWIEPSTTFKSKSPKISPKIIKSKIDLNGKFGYCLSYSMFYANIILNKIEDPFNIKEFNDVYKFLVENRKFISIENGFTIENKMLWKIIINLTYGFSILGENKGTLVNIKNPEKIVEFSNQLVDDIMFSEFGDKILFYNTDEIYLADEKTAQELKGFILENPKYNFLYIDIEHVEFKYFGKSKQYYKSVKC